MNTNINLKNCSCGYHHPEIKMKVEIGRGLLPKTAEILKDFPRNILIVADKNTLAASDGILDILKSGGFNFALHCYDNCTEANITDVQEIEKLAAPHDGILAVGSGSIGDICRLASFNAKKEFAIFATAPSMDGFASNASPIIYGNFKETVQCHGPSVIIGDTDILAKAPANLKSSGFGDVIAKYVALVDWKIAALVSDEYYCPSVDKLVKDVLEKTMRLADKVTEEDPETAQAIMEALVLSGLCMILANSTRPASAAEHLVAHYWEIKKLERQEKMAFHGEKVGLGTLLIAKLYHEVAKLDNPSFGNDIVEWDAVYHAYGPNFKAEIDRLNTPSIMDKIDPAVVKKSWPEIRRIIKEELPSYNQILKLMKAAKAMTTLTEIDVDRQLAYDAVKFHPYMRYRINLTRLIPMLGYQPAYDGIIEQ
ncbi:MAG: sn-glycerol-1-phosphate dehydrogenase [Defluviitaleaceae bacterium]|nr:sn-glycerol-1-phosphate dehydrogenase [Defluviitaleaceae bacterium]